MRLSFKEVIVHAGHNVLMEVDDSTSMIVVDPQAILDQLLRHRLIHLLNIFIIIFFINLLYKIFYYQIFLN
jgi:hypothetical protein